MAEETSEGLDGRITDEQRQRLTETLVCQRFRDRRDKELNQKVLNDFEYKGKGVNLIGEVQKYGFGYDEEGKGAFYIVRTRDGVGLLFFSLRCGELNTPVLSKEKIEQEISRAQYVVEQYSQGKAKNLDRTQTECLQRILAQSQSYEMDVTQYLDYYSNRLRRTQDKQNNAIETDCLRDANPKITHSACVYPAVELMHFCANQSERATVAWKEFGLDRPMGEVLFWKFVVERLQEIRKLVGCQYIYLFAADEPDGRLVNYYKHSLDFSQDNLIGTNKPQYDCGCIFMSQPLNGIEKKRKQHFENFNVQESFEP